MILTQSSRVMTGADRSQYQNDRNQRQKSYTRRRLRGGRLLQVGDQTVPVLLLLQTSEHHLGARDVLLRVCQVDVKGVCAPCDALVLVGLSVGEVGRLSCLPSEQSVEVGTCLTRAHDARFILKTIRKGMRNPTLLVLAPLLDGVALGARLREDLLSRVGRHLI